MYAYTVNPKSYIMLITKDAKRPLACPSRSLNALQDMLFKEMATHDMNVTLTLPPACSLNDRRVMLERCEACRRIHVVTRKWRESETRGVSKDQRTASRSPKNILRQPPNLNATVYALRRLHSSRKEATFLLKFSLTRVIRHWIQFIRP